MGITGGGKKLTSEIIGGQCLLSAQPLSGQCFLVTGNTFQKEDELWRFVESENLMTCTLGKINRITCIYTLKYETSFSALKIIIDVPFSSSDVAEYLTHHYVVSSTNIQKY